MSRTTPKWILFTLFLLSGATGLVYELVWTRELIFVFGGTTYAITTVLVAFMGGLGLGSFVSGRISRRLAQPGFVYGALEIVIGAYALGVPLLLALCDPVYRAIYPHVQNAPAVLTAVRFLLSAMVMLLPATLMGATLPVLVRHVTLGGGSSGRSIGTLYGLNTFGAVIGVVATGFVLIPRLGLTTTTWAAALVNIAIGVIALLALRVDAEQGDAIRRADLERRGGRETAPSNLTPAARRWLLLAFAVSGFSAMVYQITWTRALIMSIGSSTYSFTCILAAFILGLALGSLLIARWVDRLRDPLFATGAAQLAIAVSAVAVLPVYGRIPLLVHALVDQFSDNFDLLLAIEFLLIIAVTIVPTLLMGALFPLVARANASREEEAGEATGKIYAVNTLGTVAGSFLGGFVLIRSDVLGVQNSITLAAALNAVGGLALVLLARQPGESALRRLVPAVVAAALVPLVVGLAGRWDMRLLDSAAFLGRSENEQGAIESKEILYIGEGADMTVIVSRSKRDPETISMSVNSKTDASTSVVDMVNFLLVGHIPALMKPDGEDVCVIGLGSGLTLGAISRYPNYQRIDSIELSEEVLHAARAYFSDYTYAPFEDARIRHIPADGRNHLLLTDQRYDLIVSQPSNPWLAGVSNLFTREYFELARSRLEPGGVFCAWVQGYTLSPENVRLIIRTLLHVFPHATLWEMGEFNFGLIASDRPFEIPLGALKQRAYDPQVRADLYRIGAGRIESVLGRFIAGSDALRGWAGDGVLHTDDNAILEFSAPRQLYKSDELALLSDLLAAQQSPFGHGIVASADDPELAEIVAAVERVIEGRRQRVRALGLLRSDPTQAMLGLLRACELDPGNVALVSFVREQTRDMPRTHPFFVNTTEGAEALRRLDHLRLPTLAPRKGAPNLRWVARALRATAQKVLTQPNPPWSLAADYLSEAEELAPDEPGLLLDLAAVLVHAGRRAEALERLQDALETGRITATAAKEHANLQFLASDAEFVALLARYGG